MGQASSVRAGISVEEMRAEIKKALDKKPAPTPLFTFLIAWGKHYDGLFDQEYVERTSLEELVLRSQLTGRVLLCGRGGSAKSEVLRRAANHALSLNILPILVDLSKWTGKQYHEWDRVQVGATARMDFLLREFTELATNSRSLDVLPVETRKLILIDSLNEVTAKVGQEIINTVDDFISFAMNTSAIVADRLVRRTIAQESKWQFSATLPLDHAEIRRQLVEQKGSSDVFDTADDASKTLLASPYFLDSLLVQGYFDLRQYFTKRVGLTDDEILSAGRAAFLSYARHHARSFKIDEFEALANTEIVKKLRASDCLRVEGEVAYFDHHLKHDYLSAVYLASDSKHWNREAFDIISFKASSFDALEMALEQIRGSEQADLFIRRMFDWNPYSPAYSVAESMRRRVSTVSQEMIIVLLAMLAERRWDLLLTTQRTAHDALQLFPVHDAKPFLDASTPQELFRHLSNVHSERQWFLEWRNLFTSKAGSEIPDKDLELIQGDDSVSSWTFANVLRRLTLSEAQQSFLRSRITDLNPTVRWRISHVLGAFVSMENAVALFDRFSHDEDGWVRYGSTRSILEMAARAGVDHSGRDFIFKSLGDSASQIANDKHRLKAFESAIFVDPRGLRGDTDVFNWGACVTSVLQKLFRQADKINERDHWTDVADRIALEYGRK